MTPRRVRYGLAAFVLLSGGAAANLMLLQPENGRGATPSRPFRGLERLPGIDSTTLSQAVARIPDNRNRGPGGSTGPQVWQTGSVEQPELTRAVQRELALRGYQPGAPDGIAGVVTRGAIMAFEYDTGQPLTATPTEALLAEIIASDPAMVGKARPAGPPTAVGPRAEQVIRTVQESLSRLGYAVGEIDGRLGHETVRAIRAFEADQKIGETGRISGVLVARLAVVLASKGKAAAGNS